MTARSEYLRAAFDVIDKEYGGSNSYLTKYLEVATTLMRKLYTK
ncbi:MAG: tyrosine-protein phosphatase [Prevotellaceae bacterium]|nr:tyrosine-protein phosphatase [Prevotellaceae bacterium]